MSTPSEPEKSGIAPVQSETKKYAILSVGVLLLAAFIIYMGWKDYDPNAERGPTKNEWKSLSATMDRIFPEKIPAGSLPNKRVYLEQFSPYASSTYIESRWRPEDRNLNIYYTWTMLSSMTVKGEEATAIFMIEKIASAEGVNAAGGSVSKLVFEKDDGYWILAREDSITEEEKEEYMEPLMAPSEENPSAGTGDGSDIPRS